MPRTLWDEKSVMCLFICDIVILSNTKYTLINNTIKLHMVHFPKDTRGPDILDHRSNIPFIYLYI